MLWNLWTRRTPSNAMASPHTGSYTFAHDASSHVSSKSNDFAASVI